jgi:hypothetical protein
MCDMENNLFFENIIIFLIINGPTEPFKNPVLDFLISSNLNCCQCAVFKRFLDTIDKN